MMPVDSKKSVLDPWVTMSNIYTEVGQFTVSNMDIVAQGSQVHFWNLPSSYSIDIPLVPLGQDVPT